MGKNNAALVGKWVLVRSEGSLGEDVAMEFSEDGHLAYSVREGHKRQVMLLTYRVTGDFLITDQPSQPREERTRFDFEPDGQLLVEFSGKKSWFRRAL